MEQSEQPQQPELENQDEESTPILRIPTQTNYWLVRADGGKFYSDFLENEYIALSHDLITVNEVANLARTSNNGVADVKTLYSMNYPADSSQAVGLRSNQIKNFIYGMSVNDIVIVPSKQSNSFSLGVITSSAYDESAKKIKRLQARAQANANHTAVCTYIKRRHVLWIKEINKKDLPKGLLWVLSAHEALFHIKHFDDTKAIDKLFSPLYIKGDSIHLVIGTNIEQNPTMSQWNAVTSLSEDADINPEAVSIDIERNSPPTFNFDSKVEEVKQLYSLYKVLKPVLDPTLTGAGFWGSAFFVWKIIGGKRGKELGLIEWCQEIYKNHYENKQLKDSYNKMQKLSKKQQTLKSLSMYPKANGTLFEHENKPKKSDKDVS